MCFNLGKMIKCDEDTDAEDETVAQGGPKKCKIS